MFGPYQANGIEITDPTTTPGFFATYGDVIDFVPSLSSRPQSFLAVTMEYGTMGLDAVNELRSANRMILDAEKYNFHCATQAVCDEIDSDTREMFNPSDPAWRHKVLREADLVFRTLRDQVPDPPGLMASAWSGRTCGRAPYRVHSIRPA